MAQYGREYRLEWIQANVWNGTTYSDITGRTIRVSIYQRSVLIGDGETPEVITMIPTGDPLTIEVVDNDRDKFTPIKAKQATIRFKSNQNQGHVLETFCDKPDNEWLVHIKDVTSSEFIFIGFLMLSDLEQLMQPDPNGITLVASDHLGVLKDIPLSDDDGNYITGKLRFAELIALCLKKTALESDPLVPGTNLSISVINNLRIGSGVLVNTGTATGFGIVSANTITLGASMAGFFYPGQRFTVSGTASNNTTFTVISVSVLLITFVLVAETPISETAAPPVTFTDEHSQGHFYDKGYPHEKTFETEIGESENCYEVLSKILGFDCYLTQYRGKWWIMRVDEFDGNPIYVAQFDPDGVYVSIAADATLVKDIGRLEVVKFANADLQMLPDRAYRLAKLVFNYVSPREIICNIDFSRGDLISAVNPLDQTFQVECWTLREGVPGHYGTVDGTTATIHRIFNANSYEQERYITLTPRTTFETSSVDDATYIESQPLPIDVNDKFTASLDFRLTHNQPGIATVRLFRFVLHGIDDSWWILDCDVDGQNPVWRDTASWTLFSGSGARDVNFETEGWQTHSIEAPKAPVSGDLYCWINQLNQNSATYDDHDIQFINLNFTYLPYINGSYQKYNGHYNQVTRATTPTEWNAALDEEVFMGDAPKKMLKGGIFVNAVSSYALATMFYSSAQFALGPPTDLTFLHPYGWHQIQAVWNQYRDNTRFFSGSVRGLGETWPDLLYKYTLTDINPNYQNRYFMLISFGQDWKSQMWTAVFAECYRISTGRIYTDTFIFKFISGNG